MAAFALPVLAVALTAATATAQRAGDAWGTNIHWTHPQPGEAAQLAAAFRVVRMDVGWDGIERAGACGTYDFSAYDDLVATLTAQSPPVRLYAIIDYCKNPCYQGGAVCSTPACFDAYAAFGAATMRHFAGKHVIFEVSMEHGAWSMDHTSAALQSRRGARSPRCARGGSDSSEHVEYARRPTSSTPRPSG